MAAKKQPGRVPGSGKNTKVTYGKYKEKGSKARQMTNGRAVSYNYMGAEGPKKSSPRKGR